MKKVVVVGGVAAGLKAAAKIRRNDFEADIVVLEKGKMISYGACGMPYYVGKDVHDIKELMMTPVGVLRDENFFNNAKGFKVLTKTKAVHIDRQTKKVKAVNVETNEESFFTYDKLVLATGASPIHPKLPGVELKNIYSFWHPDDAVAVRKALVEGKIKNAVIIGAGLVGMEMAEAFLKWKINVIVIEMKKHIFPAFLDEEVALAAEKYLKAKELTILTEEKVERFNGMDYVSEVVTDKRSISADIVIMSIGVRPNIELAKEAGLKIGSTGAIEVNECLQTSDPDIYAGGDCVENTNIITGKKVFAPMGSTANKHGRVIGDNICGEKAVFRGVLNTAIVKVTDINIGKTGLTEREAKDLGYNYITALVPGHDKPHYMPGAKLITVKLIVDADNKKVLGAQVYGEGQVDKRVDIIAAVITLGGTVDDLFDIDLAYAPPYSSPIDNAAVAANVILNKLSGRMKGISSLEAHKKLDENVVFLDVRSPQECQQIKIAECKGFKNIPLGQLRQKMGELSKEDEIIAYCKISLRGYEAETILEGAGFKNVKVMEGGIVAWPFECE